MPGRIAKPAILWKASIGGFVQEEEAIVCPRALGLDEDLLIVSPAGRLRAFTLEGELVWERRLTSSVRLLACVDPAEDGNARIVAASQGGSGAKLSLFAAKGGRGVWESAVGTGGIGAVKLASLSGATRDLLWLPAAGDTMTAFEFLPRIDAPKTRWVSRLADFTSDPYSSSSVVVAETERKTREVVVTGARGQVLTVRLDATTGREISRSRFQATGREHGYESGGSGELVQVAAARKGAARSVVTVSGYSSAQAYMFQGITVASLEDPKRDRSLDTHPAGVHAVEGSVEDFDGGGRLEILASRWDPSARHHELQILPVDTLSVRARLPDFHLLAVIPGHGRTVIVGRAGVREEIPAGNEPIVAYTYRAGAFHRAWTAPAFLRLASPAARFAEISSTDNGGFSPVVSDGSASEVLVFLRRARTSEDLCWLSLADGRIDRCDSPGPGIISRVLGVRRDGRQRIERIVLGGNDGSLRFLDGALRPIGQATTGGYFRSFAPNGHATEIAVVGPLDARGENDVVVVDSQNRILRLDGVRESTPSRPPSLHVLADSAGPQELLLIPRGEKEHGLVVRTGGSGGPALALLDRSGRELWRHQPRRADASLDSGFPLGLNAGRFGGDGASDLVASFGVPGSVTGRICAIDGGRGTLLWCSSSGGFWDAALAVGDLEGDGLDDVAFNFNNRKALIVSGRDGRPLAGPAVLPSFRSLGLVDYNGAPMLIGPGDDGLQRIVDGQDNAHLSLLCLRRDGGPKAGTVVPVWNVEQSRLDDQRDSMAAAAPGAVSPGVVLGVGSRSGVLEARSATDGSLLWRHNLFDGGEAGGPRDNALSSVLAVDVDGNGLVDFVVGGFDGWLYAFEAPTGRRVWAIDLGAPLGDPIAADVDASGSSTILVPAADGSVYAIGPAK